MFANDFGFCLGTNMDKRVRVLDFNLVVLNSNIGGYSIMFYL